MLVYPAWRRDGAELECRRAQWAAHPGLAAYVAPPRPLPFYHQIEEEYSSSSRGSSPEQGGGCGGDAEEVACGWAGCGRRARGVAALSAHVARAHAQPAQDGLFYCGWRDCSRPHRGFNARYKMLVHVRTHTNEKPHECPQCRKCFSRAENLKIHMRSHSGEKPYVCPFEGCNKAYSNSSDRFKHTRTHAVDKPYCCKVAGCGKRYTDPSSLRKHVKTYRHYPRPTPDSITPDYRHYPRPTPDSITPDYRHYPRPSSDNITPDDRVPTYDMSYVEYSRLYYPQSAFVVHKDYGFENPRRPASPLQRYEEQPLDLKCRARYEDDRLTAKPEEVEYQLRPMEMPLDLSTKT